MKTFERLNKNEMRMIVGGRDATIEDGGATCNCNTKDDCKDKAKPSCYNCGSGGSGGQSWGNCDK
jgi:hypothetical protein